METVCKDKSGVCDPQITQIFAEHRGQRAKSSKRSTDFADLRRFKDKEKHSAKDKEKLKVKQLKNPEIKLLLVAGARPNFMKIAPIVRVLKAQSDPHPRGIRSAVTSEFHRAGITQITQIEYKIVHTGQHYDYEMSQAFFDDLELPKPDFFLEAGSGSHAVQTAKIMVSFEKVCEDEKPDIVVVVGDVNSTLACSVVAKKFMIEVAHVEAGLRSFDLSMPEEINRMVPIPYQTISLPLKRARLKIF